MTVTADLVDVPAADWFRTVEVRRDAGFTWFDMLTAVDDGDLFIVVCALTSTADRRSALLRTTVPRDEPVLDSVTPLFAGADWHERETAEMYGITFAGHPNPAPLLLPDPAPFPAPLRKAHELTRREP